METRPQALWMITDEQWHRMSEKDRQELLARIGKIRQKYSYRNEQQPQTTHWDER